MLVVGLGGAEDVGPGKMKRILPEDGRQTFTIALALAKSKCGTEA